MMISDNKKIKFLIYVVDKLFRSFFVSKVPRVTPFILVLKYRFVLVTLKTSNTSTHDVLLPQEFLYIVIEDEGIPEKS